MTKLNHLLCCCQHLLLYVMGDAYVCVVVFCICICIYERCIDFLKFRWPASLELPTNDIVGICIFEKKKQGMGI